MLKGHCLCGGVRYEISGELGPVTYCHCSQCRRASGSAFGSNASAHADEVTFVAGRELIREFESSPGKFRAFCSHCGSPLYARRNAKPQTLRMRLGTLEGGEGLQTHGHIWVSSKAAWYCIDDGLAQCPEMADDAILFKDGPDRP